MCFTAPYFRATIAAQSFRTCNMRRLINAGLGLRNGKKEWGQVTIAAKMSEKKTKRDKTTCTV
jgi:hypothetical protein